MTTNVNAEVPVEQWRDTKRYLWLMGLIVPTAIFVMLPVVWKFEGTKLVRTTLPVASTREGEAADARLVAAGSSVSAANAETTRRREMRMFNISVSSDTTGRTVSQTSRR